MATNIAWTDETWNPIIGCTIVSAGCIHCYAMRDAWIKSHNSRLPQYHGLAEKVNGNAVWTGVIRRNSQSAFDKVTKWQHRKGLKIFVNSMGDLFHEKADPAEVLEVIAIIRDLPDQTFQVLTKRPAYAAEFVKRHQIDLPHNFWMGVSVEDERVVERIDILRTIPALVRFISAEPLIGPLGKLNLEGIHWVITGGESGQGARFCDPAWVRDIQRQCKKQGVAFFHKQHGENPENFTTGDRGITRDGDHGGFLIDGVQYQEFPDTPLPLLIRAESAQNAKSRPESPPEPVRAPAPLPAPEAVDSAAPIDPQWLVTDELARRYEEQQQKAVRTPVVPPSAPAPKTTTPAPAAPDPLLRLVAVVEGLAAACEGFAATCASAAVSLRALAAEIAEPEPAPESESPESTLAPVPSSMPPIPSPKTAPTKETVDRTHIMPVLRALLSDGAVWQSDALRFASAQKLGLEIDARYMQEHRWALGYLGKTGEIAKVGDQRYQKR